MGRILLVQIGALFFALAASAQNPSDYYTSNPGGFGQTTSNFNTGTTSGLNGAISINYIYLYVDTLIVIRRGEIKKCVDTLALNGQSIVLKTMSDGIGLPPDENEWIRFTDFFMNAGLKTLIFLRAPFLTVAGRVYKPCYLPPVNDVAEVDGLIKAYLTPTGINQTTGFGTPAPTIPISTETPTDPGGYLSTPSPITPSPAVDPTNPGSTTNTITDQTSQSATPAQQATPGQQKAPAQSTTTGQTPSQTPAKNSNPNSSNDSGNNGIYIPNYE